MWDERYSGKEYAYGTEPNDFLRSMADRLPVGKSLCLADGEGRNGVWLAQQGHEVTAVDASKVGLEKAKQLALQRNVTISTIRCDLAQFELGCEQWDLIVSIFCHLPPSLRCQVHHRAIRALKPNGIFLLEAYTPAQLQYKTGGPPVVELMMDSQCLRRELHPLTLLHLEERVRELNEGRLHQGQGAVVQLLARKEP
ncbi:class I SAM-dependent methyltransferase [Ectothiorhodospiraceae bacterium BW-2]|nr:class I SAM-dependent methyltransferase [Ectothiorhodospiraceae bacterium BW-2]